MRCSLRTAANKHRTSASGTARALLYVQWDRLCASHAAKELASAGAATATATVVLVSSSSSNVCSQSCPSSDSINITDTGSDTDADTDRGRRHRHSELLPTSTEHLLRAYPTHLETPRMSSGDLVELRLESNCCSTGILMDEECDGATHGQEHGLCSCKSTCWRSGAVGP